MIGVSAMGQVIYELHAGTFTPEGTFDAAARHLASLRDLGITVVELMPLADFPGRFGWGYDGVALWAPSRLYGRPDDLRRFVDTAHRLGIGVILDVVYNHLGPDACFLDAFAPGYFTDRHATDWGRALDFDGPDSAPVREYFVENAAHWIQYHLDGLRLDATDMIFDDSPRHLLQNRRARTSAAAPPPLPGGREPGAELAAGRDACQRWLASTPCGTVTPSRGVVALTGRSGRTTAAPSAARRLVSAVRWGYLFQGQYYRWRRAAGRALVCQRAVHFLENRPGREHARGAPRRVDSRDACERGALLLALSPATPMCSGTGVQGDRAVHLLR
jgi:maltooligosyltrehalose trehalohydrolase